ncbi:MAG: hypothetical protein IJ710_05670 [Prevotella sp.]|nr:hypothetical protein [Prevotella sp.]
MENKLNELDGKEWIKFTKSWFKIAAKSRTKEQKDHPAKYPEELVEEFVAFFTKTGQTVLDPFVGVGSTIVGAEHIGRHGIGIELNPNFFAVAQERVSPDARLILGDARQQLAQIEDESIDYIMTSPPYWNILRKKRGHSDSQHTGRVREGLALYYSEDQNDLGNIDDYNRFIDELDGIFRQCADKLKRGKYMTIVIQNFRNDDGHYMTLAWDLAQRISAYCPFEGERIWLQEDKKLGIWGFRSSFILNIHHHYCLIFRKR